MKLPFSAARINLENIVLSKYVRQRKTNAISYNLHVESKKLIQTNVYAKQKQT